MSEVVYIATENTQKEIKNLINTNNANLSDIITKLDNNATEETQLAIKNLLETHNEGLPNIITKLNEIISSIQNIKINVNNTGSGNNSGTTEEGYGTEFFSFGEDENGLYIEVYEINTPEITGVGTDENGTYFTVPDN